MMTRPLAPDTAFGLTRLDTEHWLARHRGRLVPIRLEDMSDRHRRNLLAWLREHARLMQDHERRAIKGLYLSGFLTGAEHDDRQARLAALPPEVWLEDTVLVRRLVQLAPPTPRPLRRRRQLPARLGGR